MRKHSVVVAGHATSISLEDEFWEELKAIAMQRNIKLNDLISEIDDNRQTNLSSALRLYILNHLKSEHVQE